MSDFENVIIKILKQFITFLFDYCFYTGTITMLSECDSERKLLENIYNVKIICEFHYIKIIDLFLNNNLYLNKYYHWFIILNILPMYIIV